MHSYTEVNLGAFLALFFVIWLVILVFLAISYVLSALGLYKIAKKMNHPTPYLAWIPVVSTYLLGELAKDEIKKVKNITTPNFLYDNLGLVLALAPLVMGPIAIIPILGWIAIVAANVFILYLTILAILHIYKQFVDEGKAALYVVLYFFLAPVAMIIIGSKEILHPNEFTSRHNPSFFTEF